MVSNYTDIAVLTKCSNGHSRFLDHAKSPMLGIKQIPLIVWLSLGTTLLNIITRK